MLPSRQSTGILQAKNRPVTGILGGICSGKTTVSKIFEKNGFERIDADRIAHSLLETEKVRKKLLDVFGDAILSAGGMIDRKALSDIVFEDASELAKLNSIIHPLVIGIIRQRLADTDSPAALDAALLSETGLDRRFCNCLVFVDRPVEERETQAVEKRGWRRGELRRREAMQHPVDVKKKKADFVIPNTGTLNELDERVKDVIDRIVRSP